MVKIFPCLVSTKGMRCHFVNCMGKQWTEVFLFCFANFCFLQCYEAILYLQNLGAGTGLELKIINVYELFSYSWVANQCGVLLHLFICPSENLFATHALLVITCPEPTSLFWCSSMTKVVSTMKTRVWEQREENWRKRINQVLTQVFHWGPDNKPGFPCRRG